MPTTNPSTFSKADCRIAVAARVEGVSVSVSVIVSFIVSIADTGIGLAAEEPLQVLDMFAQLGTPRERSRSGLGIELAMEKSLSICMAEAATPSAPGAVQAANSPFACHSTFSA